MYPDLAINNKGAFVENILCVHSYLPYLAKLSLIRRKL